MSGARTVVVGAGIVGCAIAYRLAAAGHEVLLVDRDDPGRGCSRGNAGVLATHALEPLATPANLKRALRLLFGSHGPLSIRPRHALRALPWLARFALAARHVDRGTQALAALQAKSLDAFTALMDDAGLRDLLRTRGHLLVTEDGANEAAIRAEASKLSEFGVNSRWLDRHALAQLAPGLSGSVVGGQFFADTAHVVDPHKVCRGLAAAAERHGARVARANVDGLRALADGFVLDAGEERIQCDRLVLAAGVHSAPLARALGARGPLEAELGYHLTLPGVTPEFRLPVSSYERHTYMTPMAMGLRITGFVELGGTALPPDPRRYADLRRHVAALLPGTDPSRASEWMGCRPSLPDHLPVIGPAPGRPNAQFAFGHQHLGLTLSGITADIVLALAEGRPPPVDPAPYDAARFR